MNEKDLARAQALGVTPAEYAIERAVELRAIAGGICRLIELVLLSAILACLL